jgi:hypothetical protein
MEPMQEGEDGALLEAFTALLPVVPLDRRT